MAFKFPFTNYHELNLTWVLEQLKKLFEESEENVETIETYDNRLSVVETEVTDLESTTTQAINTANAAATNAATALSRANTANQNALTASSQAGAATVAAQDALQEAQTATQAAQQAQATAMTFDGRITQAQNDASAAVHEAESFENRVNAAINTANNAANTATIAQGIAVNANQTAAQALDIAQTADGKADANADKIGNLSDLTTTAKNNLVAAINEAAQTGGADDTKAPLIVANASGDAAYFKDGADDMSVRHLIATINPIQAGTGDPSPSNVRPITGRTGLSGARTGKNIADINKWIVESGVPLTISDGVITLSRSAYQEINNKYVLPNKAAVVVSFHVKTIALENASVTFAVYADGVKTYPTIGASTAGNIFLESVGTEKDVIIPLTDKTEIAFGGWVYSGTVEISKFQIEYGSSFSSFNPYEGENISVSWATEAGVIYGGSVDVVTGELTDAFTSVDMGSLSWAQGKRNNDDTGNIFYIRGTLYKNLCELKSSILKALSPQSLPTWEAMPVNCCMSAGSGYYIICMNYDTVEDLKAGVTGQQIIFELANPQTYHITPITVNTLLGDNTIYVDSGPVSVDYPADTKLYIDGKVAELQALILEN